jgi:phytanoyl-CoA hydroxylase
MDALAIDGNDSPLPQLFANDGPLAPESVIRLKPSSPDEPIEDLLARLHRDGYLFVKQLLPRASVLKAREEYFKFLSPTGVLDPGSAPVDGIYDSSKDTSAFPGIGAGSTGQNSRPGAEQAQIFVDLAIQAHRKEWYTETFCRNPVLIAFIARLTGWGDKTLLFRRSLLRNNIPGTQAIGVHYDQIFLRWGDLSNLTAWWPKGDISIDGGGLIYLEGSQKLGEQFEMDFLERARKEGFSETETNNAFNRNMLSNGLLSNDPAEFGRKYGKRWMASDYEAGDVVLHLPYMVSLGIRAASLSEHH